MSNDQNPESDNTELKQNLNFETGKLSWLELQRHFARGSVVVVSTELDLVEVAVCLAQNNKSTLEKWMSDAHVVHASDEDAKRWHSNNSELWAVVIAPWVLVQEIKPS